MPPPNDLPVWLRQGGVPGRRRDDQRRPGLLAALAVLLLAAGGGGGYWLASRRIVPPAPPPAPVCPPVVACITPPASSGGGGATGAARPRHVKKPPVAAALVPLPEAKPLEEEQRKKELRAFAAKRVSELRDCLDDPDRGLPQELGAAFELDANGAVEVVQILGADAAPKEVRHCYSAHLKKWRFPKELLRGEEKVLVNFVP
jgi:hypothetical protein